MNPIPQFTPHLKQLRLSGILDFLEVRNPQAVEQKLAYTDFLALLIVGPCGTSKSHLAQALGHIAVRRGYDIVFTSHAKLLGQLASARAVGTYERKLAALAKADLLIIDDFGLKPMRSGQDEDFHYVIADRYDDTDDHHQQSGLLGVERRLPQQVAGRGHPLREAHPVGLIFVRPEPS